MQTMRQIVRVASLRYDAVGGAFDGRVDVERDGRSFRYPVRLRAPASAPRDWVEAEMAAMALGQSDTPRFDGRSSIGPRAGRATVRAEARAAGLPAWFPWMRPAVPASDRPAA